MHQRWEGFKGERMDGDKPIFSVKRASIIGRARASLTVEMYDSPGEEYQIEGCFSQRCCTVFNVTKESVAEIRRKVDPTTSVVLGREVFSLCVKAGFDAAFAMGFVLVLDQINGEDYVDSGATTEPAVHPATEDWKGIIECSSRFDHTGIAWIWWWVVLCLIQLTNLWGLDCPLRRVPLPLLFWGHALERIKFSIHNAIM